MLRTILARPFSATVSQLTRTFLHHERGSTSSAWHVNSAKQREELNNLSFGSLARFLYFPQSREKRGSRISLWLAGLCIPDEETARNGKLWRWSDVDADQGVLECTTELLERLKDGEGIAHEEWMDTAPHCAMQYFNDTKHFPGDTLLEAERMNKRRKYNVHF